MSGKRETRKEDWEENLGEGRRPRRWVKDLAWLGPIALAFLLVLLFSPIGPFRGLLFPAEEVVVERKTVDVGREVGFPEEESAESRKTSEPAAPAIAIVIDDVQPGYERNKAIWLGIEAPLTFSMFPYGNCGPLAEELYQAGFQIMMHVPTENPPPHDDPEPHQLHTGMGREEVMSTLDADLANIPHVSGINNHQGVKGCGDLQLMTWECEWARDHGLFVLDSHVCPESKVCQAAASVGLPRKMNQVFIDHEDDSDYIRSAMRELADIARREGFSIGICHFGPQHTPGTVKEMIGELRSEGLNFAFVRDISN